MDLDDNLIEAVKNTTRNKGTDNVDDEEDDDEEDDDDDDEEDEAVEREDKAVEPEELPMPPSGQPPAPTPAPDPESPPPATSSRKKRAKQPVLTEDEESSPGSISSLPSPFSPFAHPSIHRRRSHKHSGHRSSSTIAPNRRYVPSLPYPHRPPLSPHILTYVQFFKGHLYLSTFPNPTRLDVLNARLATP